MWNNENLMSQLNGNFQIPGALTIDSTPNRRHLIIRTSTRRTPIHGNSQLKLLGRLSLAGSRQISTCPALLVKHLVVATLSKGRGGVDLHQGQLWSMGEA